VRLAVETPITAPSQSHVVGMSTLVTPIQSAPNQASVTLAMPNVLRLNLINPRRFVLSSQPKAASSSRWFPLKGFLLLFALRNRQPQAGLGDR